MSEQPPTPEVRHTNPIPRIYVASLSDYNAGRLHGRWIDVTGDVDSIYSEITDMLATAPEPGAEEWAIHDYEGFGPVRLSEYENLDTVAAIGEGIATHGYAFAAWASHLDRGDLDQLDAFEDHYRGKWPSLDAYAEDLLESLGYDLDELGPPELAPYIRFDLDAWANVTASDLIVVEDPESGEVHIFDIPD